MFVDTSGWACSADRRQPFHTLAGSQLRRIQASGSKAVTTSYVLAELTGLLISPLKTSRLRQLASLRNIRTSPSVEIVFVDAALEADGWTYWESRLDKDWSLVDCVSFLVMQRRGLTDALTTDHHFEQAGFTRLLK